ncbi:fimbrial protein [Providencia alcalifaciens]|uniref:fimbrial protein n=1 Tax=Providencia TaxID=586 RepID=UPI001E35B2FB|nr:MULTISPECIES: fimbrial protein [Providencia]
MKRQKMMRFSINRNKVLKLLVTYSLPIIYLFNNSVSLAEVFTLNLKIEVVQKSCNVYGDLGPNQPIEVKFGEMNLNGFTSARYRQDINYHLDCGDASSNNPNLKLIFESDITDFDPTLVKTSNSNLGLKIFFDNQLLSPKEYREFSYSQKPLLSVLPVLNTENKIELGPFTSTGVLKIEYQ